MFRASLSLIILSLISSPVLAGCIDILSYEPDLDDPTLVVVQTDPTPNVPDEVFQRPGTTRLIVGGEDYRCVVVDAALACRVAEGLFGTYRVRARQFGRDSCNSGITVEVDTVIED